MSRLSLIITAASIALFTSGCRKEEQNRPTAFTPGVYQGEAMPTLTKATVTELSKRGQLQK